MGDFDFDFETFLESTGSDFFASDLLGYLSENTEEYDRDSRSLSLPYDDRFGAFDWDGDGQYGLVDVAWSLTFMATGSSAWAGGAAREVLGGLNHAAACSDQQQLLDALEDSYNDRVAQINREFSMLGFNEPGAKYAKFAHEFEAMKGYYKEKDRILDAGPSCGR